ncbi:transcription factor IIA, alpha/beta subunit-domain-containing protein [Mycena galericulata]|nr:transcription factor IIA, alpha/beta subunit-domain-containing protein [Mycena galericulata]
MSNEIVPTVYRIIIDEVISSIKQELEAHGVAEDVLIQLQHVREHFYTWEDRVIASRVVDFESPKPSPRFPPRLATMTPQYEYVPTSSFTASSETINSDLDDSDTEEEEDEDPNPNIAFCTYDKVTRVKSKWKCSLKNGMIHTNGKDYLFSRCTCECLVPVIDGILQVTPFAPGFKQGKHTG